MNPDPRNWARPKARSSCRSTASWTRQQRRGGLDARTGAPRPRRSKGRPKGRTDASEPGTSPATRATLAELAGAGLKPAAAHYRKGEVERSRGGQARPDGAVPWVPRGRSTGVGGTVGFPPQATLTEKGQRRGSPVAGLVIPAKERGGAARSGLRRPDRVSGSPAGCWRSARVPVRRCGKRGSGRGRFSAPATGWIAGRNPDTR